MKRVGAIVARGNTVTAAKSYNRGPTYKDDTVSEAIVGCANFGHVDVLPSLASAFKDGLSEAALHALRDLGLKAGFEKTNPM